MSINRTSTLLVAARRQIVQRINSVSHQLLATRLVLSSVGQISMMPPPRVVFLALQAEATSVQMAKVVLRIPFVANLGRMQFLHQLLLQLR